jgi:hypothetical protein
VLVVLGAAAAGVWWRQAAWGFNGLGPGGVGGVAMAGSTNPAEHHERKDSDGGLETVFTYGPGATLRTGFSVGNTGKHDVRITGVTPMGAWFMARQQAYVGVDDLYQPGGDGPTGRVVPLRPFTLSPGGHRWIEVEYRFGPCGAGSNTGSISWHSQQVEYTVLGVHRRGEIELFSGVVVEHTPLPCQAAG